MEIESLTMRKFDYADPAMIVEFGALANFIKPNNTKDQLTYLHTYLNNLINQILREESMSNESLEATIKLFLKKKINIGQKQSSSGGSLIVENVKTEKKLSLEFIHKSYQT